MVMQYPLWRSMYACMKEKEVKFIWSIFLEVSYTLKGIRTLKIKGKIEGVSLR